MTRTPATLHSPDGSEPLRRAALSTVPKVWVTSAGGRSGRATTADVPVAEIVVFPDRERQTLLGIGGSLTQASAAALATLSPARRAGVLASLFGPEGAAYSMSRTHVASCDFSTSSYTYVPERDPSLDSFSINVDRSNGHLGLIRDALAVPGAQFGLIASPWTAPPWMKDNQRFFDPVARRGGRLLDEHHETYARYIARYLEAYAAEGVDIWAVTPVNEPHGNHGAWESMEMSPAEQAAFVPVLGRTLRDRGLSTRILVYDQNRRSMSLYADAVFRDPEAATFAYGTAVHWYDSTFRVFEDELDRVHEAFPDRPILHTEGCIDTVFRRGADRGPDAPLPWWRDDAWYWRKEAKDWGWDWEENPEVDHPPYAPAFRYARDLVGGLAHWLAAWVDWNIVLDKRGGPNHAANHCLAPVLVDGESDTVYYTPLFHLLSQVSRTSRPGAVVLDTAVRGADGLWATALRNPDGGRVVHVFNESETDVACQIDLGGLRVTVESPSASLITVRVG